MHLLDYIVIVSFLVFLILLGLWLARRAGKNTDEFILAGRSLPWWLAGTSMAAAGLNASTMLQDSRKIRQDGIAGMWFTWANVIGGIIASVWFIRLWRRGRFTTQMEFYHARYTGWKANFTRVYDSVVYGVVVAAIWASVGVVGMRKIADVLLDLPETLVVFGVGIDSDLAVVVGLILVTLIYSAASGVYGVVWTDLIEFGVAMLCSYILLFHVFREVGWNVGLREKMEGLGAEGERILTLVPEFGPVLLFFFLIGPLLNQGAYNPHIQRFLAVKNEREVVFTTLYNAIVNLVLKSWPYYIIGLAGIFIVSDAYLLEAYEGILTPKGEVIPDYEKVFPALIEMYLPVGLVGLMVVGFLAAFMSSFDSNIHNSAAIFINDLYRPYLVRDQSPAHYVRITRWYMVIITGIAATIGLLADDILFLTMVAFSVMQAVGFIKLLRFIWWRVNGASEITAQVVSLLSTAFFLSPLGKEAVLHVMDWAGQSGNDAFYVWRLILLTSGSTLSSVAVVLLTKPEPMEHLCAFYRRVHPFGFWGPVKAACQLPESPADSVPLMTLLTLSALGLVYGLLFAVLGLFLAFWSLSIPALGIAACGAVGTKFCLSRMYPDEASLAERHAS